MAKIKKIKEGRKYSFVRVSQDTSKKLRIISEKTGNYIIDIVSKLVTKECKKVGK